MKRRLMALLMALVMALSLVPTVAFADGAPCRIIGVGSYQSLNAAIEAAKGLEKPITITMDGNCAEDVAVPIGVTVYFGSYSYTGTATAIEEQGKIAVLNHIGQGYSWYQISVFEAVAVDSNGTYYTEQMLNEIQAIKVQEGESLVITLLQDCTSTITLPEGVLLKTEGFECSGGVQPSGGVIAQENGNYYVKPYLAWIDDLEQNFTDIQEAINVAAEWGGGTISLQHNYSGDGEFTLPEGVTLSVGDYNFTGTVKDASGKVINRNGNGEYVVGEEVLTNVAQIGETGYATLAEAVAAAESGDIVEITAADTYTLPNLPKNITIKGAVDGVIFSHKPKGSIASVPNGATFENVEFDLGTVNYHGFQHAGKIIMKSCDLNGLLFSYSDMEFTECTFNQDSDYSMWCYAGDVTYTKCIFNEGQAALNLYNEGNNSGGTYKTPWIVTVDNCTFNHSKDTKAEYAAILEKTYGTSVYKLVLTGENSVTGVWNGSKSGGSAVVGEANKCLVWVAAERDNEPSSVWAGDTQVWPASVPTVDVGGDQEKTATVTTEQTSKVDADEVAKVIPAEKQEAVTNKTKVTGVALSTTETVGTGDNAKSGLQAVVDKAKEQVEGDNIKKTALETAEAIKVEVTVNVKPMAYTAPDDAAKTGTVKFDLAPVAKVLVGDKTIAENIEVTNDMIDTTKPITVSFYTGFAPAQVIHVADNGDIIESFNGEGITYNGTTGVATVQISHFSALLGTEKSYAAQIGTTKYETLDAAVTAAKDGDTITLLSNVTLNKWLSFNVTGVTLDLNGKTVAIVDGGGFNFNRIAATVKNGTVTGTGAGGNLKEVMGENEWGGLIHTYAGATAEFNNVTIDFDDLTAAQPIQNDSSTLKLVNCDLSINGFQKKAIFNNCSTIEITDGSTVEILSKLENRGGAWAIQGNDSASQVALQQIIVKDSTFATNCTLSQYQNITLNNAAVTVTGAHSSVFRDALLKLTNKSTFTINGTAEHGISGAVQTDGTGNVIDFTGSSKFTVGDAQKAALIGIYFSNYADSVIKAGDTVKVSNFDQLGTDRGSIQIFGKATIEAGANVESSGKLYVTGTGEIGAGKYDELKAVTGNLTITGGYFNFDPTPYLAEGYEKKASDIDGYEWMVGKAGVAQVDGIKYATLAEAIEAVKTAEVKTITLLDDLADVGSVSLPAGVTLDGAGKKLSGDSAVYINVAGGTVQNVVFENIHNTDGKLSAIYASGLTGTATITGCTFDGWDWDAIQMTPVAGAEVSITKNTFNAVSGVNVKRAVHVESTTPYTGIDFSATVTDNKFTGCGNLSNRALEVYYVKNAEKLVASGNYIDNGSVYLGTGSSMNNAFAKALPLMDETLTSELDIVAHCGTKFYTSFDDAFAAMNAAKGATITLFKDVTVDSTKVVDIPENQFCTINLNGHNINGGNVRVFQVKSGKLTLSTPNGTTATVSSNPAQSSSVIRVGDNNATEDARVDVYSGVTISTATAYGISAFGAKTETVNVYGTVTSTAPANNAYDGCAIATLGTDTTPAKITVSAGATVSAANTNAIYLPSGILTVQGDATTVTGTTGIYVKGGSATIKGGTITGNGAKKAYQYYGNGGISTGDALVIDNCGYPTDIDSVAINGGTFVSTNGVKVGAYYGNTKTEIATITSTNNALTVPEGYVWKETATAGTYQLTEVIPVVVTEKVTQSGSDVMSGGNKVTVKKDEGVTAAEAAAAVVAAANNKAMTEMTEEQTNINEAIKAENKASAASSTTTGKVNGVALGQPVEYVQGNDLVDIVKKTAVQGGAATAGDQALQGITYEELFKNITVDLTDAAVIKTATEEKETIVTKMTYEVTPIVTTIVNGQKVTAVIPNELITAPLTFRLSVDDQVAKGTVAKVKHNNTLMTGKTYQVEQDSVTGKKYIEVSSQTFSPFSYELELNNVRQGPACVYGKTLLLESNVFVRYYIEADAAEAGNFNVSYLFDHLESFKDKVPDVNKDLGRVSSLTPCTDKEKEDLGYEGTKNLYYFNIPVFVKEFADEITVTITDEKPVGDGNSKFATITDKYSVRQYCQNMIANPPSGMKEGKAEQLQTLCRILLDYGSYMQEYKGYHDSSAEVEYANDGFEHVTLSEIPEGNYTNLVTNVSDTSVVVGASLMLEDVTKVRFYFYGNVDGSLTQLGETDYYYIEAGASLPACRLNEAVSATVGTMGLQYSPLAYAYSMQNDATVGNLCKAMYQYYQAAAAYFDTAE